MFNQSDYNCRSNPNQQRHGSTPKYSWQFRHKACRGQKKNKGSYIIQLFPICFGPHKKQCEWWKTNTAQNAENTILPIRHVSGYIMLWGYFSSAPAGKVTYEDGFKCGSILELNQLVGTKKFRLHQKFSCFLWLNAQHIKYVVNWSLF